MNISVLGGGPAGLYFSYLMKRSFPDYGVRVFEQNPADATFGFGVVLSGRALAFLAEGDPATIERIKARMQIWSDQHIVHRGVRVVVDGSSYAAIERIALLSELQRQCRDVGVEMIFGQRVEVPQDLDNCDVLVGADGANSVVRDSRAQEFGTRATDLRNHFAWYGVEHPYPAHTLTFQATPEGVFCGHHYRYTHAMSTFVAEVDADTWLRSGMVDMTEPERHAFTQSLFTDTLAGKPLLSNKSAWKRWRLVSNQRWYVGKTVLIGDALRTAHPSIGSGTRLAMEDSVALWRAFVREDDDIDAAFVRFEQERRPVRERLSQAAEKSIIWYEAMARKMSMAPYDFVYDYLLRTGIISPERLAIESPGFMARYEARDRLTA